MSQNRVKRVGCYQSVVDMFCSRANGTAGDPDYPIIDTDIKARPGTLGWLVLMVRVGSLSLLDLERSAGVDGGTRDIEFPRRPAPPLSSMAE
jgi:hypothetical protein